MDGNFTAQHMKMKRPLNDVALADGLAYMIGETQYHNHVSSAPDNKEVSMAPIYRWKSHPFRNQIVRTIALSMMSTNPTNPT